MKAYDRIPLAVKEHMGATVAAVATARERAALNGVMLLWFLLTAAAVLFFAIDIHTTRESPILKWGFVLLTAYSGPLGAFLYVLGCREPLPGLHEQYVAARCMRQHRLPAST